MLRLLNFSFNGDIHCVFLITNINVGNGSHPFSIKVVFTNAVPVKKTQRYMKKIYVLIKKLTHFNCNIRLFQRTLIGMHLLYLLYKKIRIICNYDIVKVSTVIFVRAFRKLVIN